MDIEQYHKYLKGLDYPEYARVASRSPKGSQEVLDLSLWGDAIHPGMVTAMKGALLSISKYEYAQNEELLERMASRFGYPKKYISVVAGADDALRIAAQYCIRPRSRVLIPVPSFGRYEYHAYVNEADIHFMRFDQYPYEMDIEKIVDYAKKHKIDTIFLASPNNPTGSVVSTDQLKYLLESVSSLVIFDESLLIETHGPIPASFLKRYDNLFICGSFSKLYSLAGVRIGYMVTNSTHYQGMQKLVSPFEVSSLAIALANFAMSQDKWVRFKAQHIRKGVDLLNRFNHPSIRVSHTSTSVALLEYTNSNRKLYNLLRSNGVLTVSGSNFRGLEGTNTVRIIIRHERDIVQLLRRLRKLL